MIHLVVKIVTTGNKLKMPGISLKNGAMKKNSLVLISMALSVVILFSYCKPSVSFKSKTTLSAEAAIRLEQNWHCVYYVSCPLNPSMGAPCKEYFSNDTTMFGNGSIQVEFGPNNTIYRTTSGNFKYYPGSYLYDSFSDSLTYQVYNDSVLLLTSHSQVSDTLKINTLKDSLLVLKFSTTVNGNTVEIDSLKR